MNILICRHCESIGWVCEVHDRATDRLSTRADACSCGVEAPCPICNAEEPPRPTQVRVLVAHDP